MPFRPDSRYSPLIQAVVSLAQEGWVLDIDTDTDPAEGEWTAMWAPSADADPTVEWTGVSKFLTLVISQRPVNRKYDHGQQATLTFEGDDGQELVRTYNVVGLTTSAQAQAILMQDETGARCRRPVRTLADGMAEVASLIGARVAQLD